MTISSNYNSMLQQELNKVSKQITTGNKISQGYEDSILFKKNLDLENDIAVTSQLQENAQSAKAFSQYTDTTLDSMTRGMEEFKVKLLGYAGNVHSTTSREALVGELKSIKNSMIQLSNTKVNGEYIFGGTNNKIPPIDIKGEYQGNGHKLSIRTDKFQTQEYSIDGASLFLGYDRDIKSKVSTNIRKMNQTDLNLVPPKHTYINADNSIEDLTGTKESTTFYMSGTRPDGTGFKYKFNVENPSEIKMSDLAEEIKLVFNDDVTVELSKNGQFMIEDKFSGNSKLNFHMIGSTQNVDNISELDESKIFEFVESGGAKATVGESLLFKKEGNLLTNNVQQFISTKEGFATERTKLSEVATDSLLNTNMIMSGADINGDDFSVSLVFGEDSTSVNINGSAFDFDGGAEDFTYKQLTEIMGVALSGVDTADFEQAVLESEKIVDVEINHRGEFKIRDLTSSTTNMNIAMYDSNIDDFSTNMGSPLSFNSNKAIDLDRPSIDLFDSLDQAIKAVQEDLFHLDGTRVGFENNRGIQGSLDNITHIVDHVIKERTVSGAQYQNIEYTLDRSEALKINMKVTKNDLINTDFAETSAYFQALSLNYEAMLSTVAKTQGMSLLNYM